jgi:hypothetical protein
MSRQVAQFDQRWGYPALPPTPPKFISALQGVDMEDVMPRMQYALFPYASVTHDQIDGETPYKAGTDLFWRPSSNLQLLATLNSDFRGVGNAGAPLTMVYTRRIGGPTDEFVVQPGTEVETQELYQLTELQGAAKATGQLGSFRYGVMGAASYTSEQCDDLDSFGNGSYKIGPSGDASVRYDTDPTRTWAFGLGGGWFEVDLQGNSYTLKGQID